MNKRWVRLLLAAALLAAVPAALWAQSAPPASPKAAKKKAQTQPPPLAAPTVNLPVDPDDGAPAPAGPPKAAAAPRAVACTGTFAKNSSHLKLATVYGSQNLTFAEVDGPDSTKLMASVLFPKDAKRRLEVLWTNEATRSDTSLIVIGGQSTWTGPKGLRLGLALDALEKLNGKPFRLKGFGADGATVADWQGGALDKLPGGCKVGVRLAADAKAPEEARQEVSGEKDLVSSDAPVRAVRPKISEIIIGY